MNKTTRPKIAIILPVARLDKYGYQHLWRLIVQNHCDFADKVFVLSTSRFVTPDLFQVYQNVELVSHEDAWADFIDGHEVMNLDKISYGFDQCQALMKRQGYNVCLNIHINQYIPRQAFEPLRVICDDLVKNNKPFTWLYKKYQLCDLLFNADCRLPWIMNLQCDDSYRFGADSIIQEKTGDSVRIELGDFRKYNDQAIIDVLGEHTLQDAKEKYEYVIKEHRKLNGTYNPNDGSNLIFRADEYFPYNIGKINQKHASEESLDELGNKIYTRSRPDFVSYKFRTEYAPVKHGWFRRLKKSLRAGLK